MSQKAWMQAYTKGSKSLQARLEKIHAKNPEFQDFVKKHGFGGNLSVKQSGIQKKSSVATVKPVDDPHPESKKGPADREAIIKAAAQKIQDRRRAHSNRVAFGGELGGGFTMPSMGFRTYREEVELDEEIPYKDAQLKMRRGGWVVMRNGKQQGVIHPTEDHAKRFADATRETLSHKVAMVIRKKAKEIARGMGRMSLATESAANRRRIRSWDSAIMPQMRPLTVKPKKKNDPPFDADPPMKNPGIVVGRNKPEVSRVRHLARLGLKKAMEQGK